MSDQSTELSKLGISSGTWKVDPEASKLEFGVKTFWGLVEVKGNFTSYEGTLHVDHDVASGELTIDAASLDTKNAKRDEHLRSPDFFHTAAHPHVRFVSNAITSAPDGLTISGDLHAGGEVARLQVPVKVTAADGGRLHLQTTGRLSREGIGMTWNKIGMIRGDVRLSGEIELVPES